MKNIQERVLYQADTLTNIEKITKQEIVNQKIWKVINPTRKEIESILTETKEIEIPNIEMLQFELKLAERLGVTFEKIKALINRAPAND